MAGNYDITRDRVQALFPNYDHEAMATRFGLTLTGDRLEITMLNRRYAIRRRDGVTLRLLPEREEQADFDEVLTLFDVLCDAKADARLSGRFCTVNNLKGIVAGSRVANDIYDEKAAWIDRNFEAFCEACRGMGGVTVSDSSADMACVLPLFDFLPMRVQFWRGDDEFPASLKLLFDENILQYMKYETVYYAMGVFFSRLSEA